MKDNRFIELVNLYIDRQISAEETAELEAEILANAKHRQIYHQYCRMHRATSVVFDSFRTSPDSVEASVPKTGSITRFETSRRAPTRWYYGAAGLAAAACLAIVVSKWQQPSAAPESVATVAIQATPSSPVVSKAADTTPPTNVTPVMSEQQYAALLAAKRQEEIRTLALHNQKAAKPISLFEDGESLTVDGKQLYPLTKPKAQASPSDEFTAFQFQR